MATSRPRLTRRRGIAVGLIASLALIVPAAAFAAPATPGPTVDLQILDVSDWHGQIDPINLTGVGNVGGAAYLKTYFDALRAQVNNTLTITAGDDVGATPPVSNYFEDIPAIKAERMMGIQIGTFGNHNFDSGVARLQSQIDLAASTDPSVPGTPFKYVSSNLANRDANISGVSDYAIFKYKGVNVAVIGVTNEEAPTLNFPGAMGTMVPTDSVAAAMRARAAARAEGANVFIAITHKGVTSFENGQPKGELIDFANAVSGFQVIYGDHTDVAWSGEINGQFVVENRSKGVTFTKTVLTIRRGTGEVTKRLHEQVSPLIDGVTPNADIVAMVKPYRDQLAPIFNTVVGSSSVAIPRADSCGAGNGRTCESLIGDVVSDALRDTHDTDFALSNSGGLRADLTCPAVDNPSDFCPAFTGSPLPITRGQVNTVLPFGNITVKATVDGPKLKAMLENGISRMPALDGRFPQVSGLCFTYDIASPAGSRVTSVIHQAADGTCSGAAVDLSAGASYTLATNDFVVAGGDSYPVVTGGVTYGFMDQEVADWLTGQGTISPALQGRIVCADSNGGTAPNCPVALP